MDASRKSSSEEGFDPQRRRLMFGLAAGLGLAAAGGVPALFQSAQAATNGPQGFDQAKAADLAVAENGTSRPVGWNQPGECMVSVRRWIAGAGGRMAGGNVWETFVNSPATLIGTGAAVTSQAVKGDVIQYHYNPDRTQFAKGVHTLMVVSNNGDGTLKIVQSNSPANTGKVSVVDRWRPAPPANFTAHLWRFGKVAAVASPRPPAPSGLARFANSIVRWEKDSRTTWFVTPDLKRLWIPDGGTYNELKSRGFAGPHVLNAATLDALPDQRDQWVASGATWTGNRSLRRGMEVRSPDRRYLFVLQTDGNLVLYGPSGRALWATDSRTSRWRDQVKVIFQGDGNLVTYDGAGRAVWASNTNNRGADRFVVQGDGNLVIYAGSRAVWASNTNGRT